jgi:glycosyltransferase involved in cell wall biosynthesis
MTSIDVVVPVYKPGSYFKKTLIGLINQDVSDSIGFNIIVVDDGSCDEGLTKLVGQFSGIQLLTLHQNVGRSKARNIGANHGVGDFILFIDADCEPASTNLIEGHCKVFDKGFDVSFGAFRPQIQSKKFFWSGYLDKLENNRTQALRKKNYLALTSCNFAVSRKLFLGCNGFDERYCRYGFEDRDLIATFIKRNSKMHYSPELLVRHDVNISLNDICQKMEQAGQFTSGLFAKKFPDIYASMAYSKVDIRFSPVLMRIPLLCALILVPACVKLTDKLILFPYLPKWFSYTLVKTFSALAFLKGTWKALN